MGSDYYSILGLSSDATPAEIRSAYFEAARRFHPDANPDRHSTTLFIKAREAYEVLSDPQKREKYDQTLDLGEEDNAPAVSVKVVTSRSEILRLDEPQLFYALLELIPAAAPDQVQPPAANLCFVVDRSTSMQGSRIDMVKANIAQVLKSLKPADTVSLVAFSDRAEVIFPPTAVSNLHKVENRVFALQTGGGTEIYQGLLAGMEQLRLAGARNTLRQLILITDGHTYGDEKPCLLLAEQCYQEGIAISALGIGHEWNDQFLDQLAGSSGGTTTYITTPKDLARFLDQRVNLLSRIFAQNLKLSFRGLPEVDVRYCFRLQPDLMPLEPNSPISVGNLYVGKPVTLLLEFGIQALPAQMEKLTVFDGQIHMDLFKPAAEKSRFDLQFKLPVSSSPAQETIPGSIVDALSRITLYRLQEKARREVVTGDIGNATRHLQFLATHLLSRGDQDLAHTVLMEAEHIRQSRVFTKDGDKRIKYGTRALMLGSGLEALR